MESTKQKKQNPFFQWIKKAANIQGNVHKLAFDAGWQELLDYNQLKMSCFGGQQSILLLLQPRWHPNEPAVKILLLLEFLSFFVGCQVCWLRNLHSCIKRMNCVKDFKSLIQIFDLIMTRLHYNFHLVGHPVFQFSKSLTTTKFSVWGVSSFAWNVHFAKFFTVTLHYWQLNINGLNLCFFPNKSDEKCTIFKKQPLSTVTLKRSDRDWVYPQNAPGPTSGLST